MQSFNTEKVIPEHPGELLRREYLIPLGLTQQQLADDLHVPFQRINGLVNGKRGVSPGTSLRLAKYFRTSDDFWMKIQTNWDLHWCKNKESSLLDTIQPFEAISTEPAKR